MQQRVTMQRCAAVISRLMAALLIAVPLLAAGAATAHADRATDFMNRVARDLLAASRSRSSSAIERVIHNYADVHGIGKFALGRYAGSLRRHQNSTYYNGMVRFMSRYAATEAPKYPVAKAVVVGRSFPFRGHTGVDSRVTLQNGSTYDVRWLLIKRGSSYKVRDAEVFGFRMKEALRALFIDHIQDKQKGGSVASLVKVLSR